MRHNKKAEINLQDMGTIAVSFVVAVLIIGIGATILTTIQSNQYTEQGTIYNESKTLRNDTYANLNHNNGITVSSVNIAYNLTLNTTQYSYTSLGEIKLSNSAGAWNNTLFNVTYSYNVLTHAANASGYGISSLSTMAQYTPTISVVVIAAIIISTLAFLYYGRKKEE